MEASREAFNLSDLLGDTRNSGEDWITYRSARAALLGCNARTRICNGCHTRVCNARGQKKTAALLTNCLYITQRRRPPEDKQEQVRPFSKEWYVSPYLTCKECNTCCFVNDQPLRLRLLQLLSPGPGLFTEVGCTPHNLRTLTPFVLEEANFLGRLGVQQTNPAQPSPEANCCVVPPPKHVFCVCVPLPRGAGYAAVPRVRMHACLCCRDARLLGADWGQPARSGRCEALKGSERHQTADTLQESPRPAEVSDAEEPARAQPGWVDQGRGPRPDILPGQAWTSPF